MYIVRRYNDLLIEINLCQLRIKDLETQIENIDKLMMTPPGEYKSIDYSGMPKGCKNYTTLDRYVTMRYNAINSLDFEYDLYENLLDQKQKFKDKLKQLEGIEYKIAYLRIIKGYSYKNIALKLGKSEQYIKNVYSRVNK